MIAIVGLDLGKFKGLACLAVPAIIEAPFTAVPTDPADLRKPWRPGGPPRSSS